MTIFLRKLAEFRTNCQNINFYRCCYFGDFLHKHAITLHEINKINEFSQVILEIRTFLAFENFQMWDFFFFIFLHVYVIISTNTRQNSWFSGLIIELWTFFLWLIIVALIILHKYVILLPKISKIWNKLFKLWTFLKLDLY